MQTISDLSVSTLMAALMGGVKKGFKGLAPRRGFEPTGAERFLKADLQAHMQGQKVLSRQVIRAARRRRDSDMDRSLVIYKRAMKRFPDLADPKAQSKQLAKRKGFADMLMATGADRKARKAALGLF